MPRKHELKRKASGSPAGRQCSLGRPTVKRVRKANDDTISTLPASPFDNLPDELILEILDKIANAGYNDGNILINMKLEPSPAEAFSTFANLSQVSKRFHRLASLYLYAGCENRTGTVGNPGKLLRTLIEAPDKAAHVKFLSWILDGRADVSSEPRVKKRYEPTQIDKRELFRALSGVELDASEIATFQKAYRHEDLRQYSQNQLAIMLLLIPNIKFFNVTDENTNIFSMWYADDDVPLWVRVLSQAAMGQGMGIVHQFESLTSIAIKMGNLKLHQVSGILNLPSLQSLILKGVFQPGAVEPEKWQCAPRSSKIQALLLLDSFVDSWAVQTLLNSISALRIFWTDFSTTPWSDRLLDLDGSPPPVSRLNWRVLASSLHIHQDTLAYVSMTECTDLKIAKLKSYDQECLGNLSGLSKIKQFEITLCAFTTDTFGDNKTPQPTSLAANVPKGTAWLKLYVDTCDMNYWVQTLEQLALSCKPALPDLKTVVAWYGLSRLDSSYTKKEMRKLRAMFRLSGVRFMLKRRQEVVDLEKEETTEETVAETNRTQSGSGEAAVDVGVQTDADTQTDADVMIGTVEEVDTEDSGSGASTEDVTIGIVVETQVIV